MIDIYYKILLLAGYIKKLLFINQYRAGKNFKLYFTGGVIGSRNKIRIGNNVSLHGWLISDGGEIIIKDNTKIHKNTVIRAMEKIEIGRHCDIGTNVYIQDHNSMSLNFLERRRCNGRVLYKSITIGDDVWIGRRAIILKGVAIGDRAVIGTGALVTHDVPPDSIVAGNPARIVKYLKYNKDDE